MLPARGLAATRSRARDLIKRGLVRVDGILASKPAQMVSQTASLELSSDVNRYVSRGAAKLIKALDVFSFDVEGRIALDVGASTGGFTHCLLQRGAQRVHAIDVGYGQLDYRLRQDSRVVVMERVNARYPFPLDDVADLATVDVSFISLTRVLHSVAEHVKEGGPIVALVKPQFEARRNEVGRGGVIRDPKVHARVLGRVIAWVVNNGFRFKGLVPSPITGEQGNREFFILVSAYH